MATPHACAALVDVFPGVLRFKRTLLNASSVQGSTTLAAVSQLGHPRISELAEHLHLDMSTVSRQVTHLRQHDLLTACPNPADGRSQQITITVQGVEELRRSRRAMVAELVQRLADWDDTDVDTLAGLLERLSRSDPSVSSPGSSPATTSHATRVALPRAAHAHLQENA